MFLFEKIEQAKIFGAYKDLPKYIEQNLTHNYCIRPYQEAAFRNFITYFETPNFCKKPIQVLFHMATGSGKTFIMAGLILYLYKQGYRNFLFFVNTDNILQKTKDNFINKVSGKYLFNNEINIDGQIIKIKSVDNFQNSGKDDINICFTTTQGLYSNLNQSKENSITEDDFAENNVVLIADEAHHLNIETKKGSSNAEEASKGNWESTVKKILHANEANILLEFTATCDLKDQYIKQEYLDKIIIDYPLRKFREDRYSKEVKTFESKVPLQDRILQAILLSQYRLKLFQDYKKSIKPVILFKSDRIDSTFEKKNGVVIGKKIGVKEFYKEKFRPLIDNLSEVDISRVRAQNKNPLLAKMFEYFEKRLTVQELVAEIKEDFSDEKCISVNSKEIKDNYQLQINSLEDRNNLIRCVFAVDQLNEGWDVLNLFDIVRLYETRSVERHGGPAAQTIQEAQLIGRGARYCPFTTIDKAERFLRKFDNDIENELRICETLLYHCMYSSEYISELTTAMKGIGLFPDNSIPCPYILKETFKNDDIYKSGFVFENKKVVKSRNTVTELSPSVRNALYKCDFSIGASSVTTILEPSKEDFKAKESNSLIKYITVSEIAQNNYSIVHKALREFNIFDFNILKNYYPNLSSLRQFITDERYLGDIKLCIKISKEEVSNEHLYLACKNVFSEVSKKISNIEEVFEGSREFVPIRLGEVFKDKIVNYTEPKGDGVGISQSKGAISDRLKLNLENEDWFVYTDNYGTSEEKAFVAYFKDCVENLKKKYDKVYLIRNERQLKIFSFEGGERFEPDYILILSKKIADKTEQLQIFIEPKGYHLLLKDKWKEDFLLKIEKEAKPIILADGNNYKVVGFPFYNESECSKQFDEAMSRL